MPFAPTQRMILVLTAVSVVLATVQAQVSSSCNDVCLGHGHCSATDTGSSCNIECKGGDCEPSRYDGSASCSTHCEATPLGVALTLVICAAVICCCCFLPCFLFYKMGESNREPAGAQPVVVVPASRGYPPYPQSQI
eukprot:m.56824 g.56824  ORF g.56824 m.56824 type:complete len:137 (+) comp17026_c0_seq5:143-553(+)